MWAHRRKRARVGHTLGGLHSSAPVHHLALAVVKTPKNTTHSFHSSAVLDNCPGLWVKPPLAQDMQILQVYLKPLMPTSQCRTPFFKLN
jgi:hypothetical protein